MIFFKGAKGYSSTPCVETFVFDELKIDNFRPFFSLSFLKIRLKITNKKSVGPIILRGKRILLPPLTHIHLKLLGHIF